MDGAGDNFTNVVELHAAGQPHFVPPVPARDPSIFAVLPNRRICAVRTEHWQGTVVLMSCGFFQDGRVGEIFASLEQPSGWLNTTLADNSILISHLLQEGGMRLADLAGKLSHCDMAPPDAAAVLAITDPMSIPRWLVETALLIEREEGKNIARIYREFPPREKP